MRRYMLAIAAALATFMSVSAFAATVTHTVKSMDANKHSVTLDDG